VPSARRAARTARPGRPERAGVPGAARAAPSAVTVYAAAAPARRTGDRRDPRAGWFPRAFAEPAAAHHIPAEPANSARIAARAGCRFPRRPAVRPGGISRCI